MITRAKFFMDNGTTTIIDLPGDAEQAIEDVIAAGPRNFVRFQNQKGGRLGENVTIGINLPHVISLEISKQL